MASVFTDPIYKFLYFNINTRNSGISTVDSPTENSFIYLSKRQFVILKSSTYETSPASAYVPSTRWQTKGPPPSPLQLSTPFWPPAHMKLSCNLIIGFNHLNDWIKFLTYVNLCPSLVCLKAFWHCRWLITGRLTSFRMLEYCPPSESNIYFYYITEIEKKLFLKKKKNTYCMHFYPIQLWCISDLWTLQVRLANKCLQCSVQILPFD